MELNPCTSHTVTIYATQAQFYVAILCKKLLSATILGPNLLLQCNFKTTVNLQ